MSDSLMGKPKMQHHILLGTGLLQHGYRMGIR